MSARTVIEWTCRGWDIDPELVEDLIANVQDYENGQWTPPSNNGQRSLYGERETEEQLMRAGCLE